MHYSLKLFTLGASRFTANRIVIKKKKNDMQNDECIEVSNIQEIECENKYKKIQCV